MTALKVHLSRTDTTIIASTDDGRSTEFRPSLYPNPTVRAREIATRLGRSHSPLAATYKAHWDAIAMNFELEASA